MTSSLLAISSQEEHAALISAKICGAFAVRRTAREAGQMAEIDASVAQRLLPPSGAGLIGMLARRCRAKA
jgi:hypothetical protein